MSSKMLELNFTILEMIFESFGMEEKHYDALVRDSSSIFRVMRYKVPAREDENLGLVAHTEKNDVPGPLGSDFGFQIFIWFF